MLEVLFIGQVARSSFTRLSWWHFVASVCLTILCGASPSTARAQSSLPAADFQPGQAIPRYCAAFTWKTDGPCRLPSSAAF